jgi:hypothetical protein
MQQIFTPSQLLRLLYNETGKSESDSIRTALQNDTFLREEYEKLVEAKCLLDESGGENPDKSVLDKILHYAQQQELQSV